MRAMVLETPRSVEQSPLVLRDLTPPTVAAGEVRVKVNCCGICHTDLHTVEGDLPLPKLPIVPGHQIVGVVNQVGRDVREVREGDRVGIPWLHWTCGECRYCKAGQENLCERARFTGLNADGGYAEYAVANAAFCCQLPKTFADVSAAPLLCAGIIGYRSLRLSGAKRGDTLGLYGFGASAHITLQIARHLGCHVMVFTRSASHRELARSLGAVWVGDAKDTPPAPLDAAIIFAPAGAVVHEALRALRKGATCALAGITMSDIPQLPYSLIYGERVLRTVANATRDDAREFLDLAAAVPVTTMVHEFGLEGANDALLALKESRIDGAGVLVPEWPTR
jgi:propanol-preferring alcohol dehydrogenase